MTPKKCESCQEYIARYAMQITDSVSMDNLLLACEYCFKAVLNDWMNEETDIDGWEIRKI